MALFDLSDRVFRPLPRAPVPRNAWGDWLRREQDLGEGGGRPAMPIARRAPAPSNPWSDWLRQERHLGMPTAPAPLTFADYERDYWAPDREAVLARYRAEAGGAGHVGGEGEEGQNGIAGASSVFSDPATREWEALLRRLVDRLSTEYTPPDYNPMLDQLRGYIGELQRPGYTPAESELLQTQVLDPIAGQKDMLKRQILERFAARGIGPGSGPVEQSLNDVDRAFAQTQTRTAANFSAQAIARDAARREQAAELAQRLPQLEWQQQLMNEGRLGQASAQLFQIPRLADARLSMAAQALMNPFQAFSGVGNPLLENQQLQQQAQNAFWQQLMQLLMGLR